MLKGVAFLVLIAALFLIANRGAYKGYFGDDEFDNLSLTRAVTSQDIISGLLTPRYYSNNFRPVSQLLYRALGATAGLSFVPYVAAIHFLHLANVVIFWLVVRRLGLPPGAMIAATLFFAFHMAVFDVYWRPAYVHDLLCGTFCLLSLLFWLEDRWIVSLICFWLAYRSKEIAVMLPFALAGYEWLFGKRRWLRLIPFGAIALWFGSRGMLFASSTTTVYSLHFDVPSLFETILFYSSRLMLVPYAGPVALIVLAAIATVMNDRRIWFGILTCSALIAPMLLLPERMSGAYLYVPLIGLAIAVGALALHRRAAWVVAALFVLWIPWNYVNLRWLRREALSQVDDRRTYISTLSGLLHDDPQLNSFLYYDAPLLPWGVSAAARWLHPGAKVIIARVDEPAARTVLAQPDVAILYWNRIARRLETFVRTPATRDASYIQMSPTIPAWQLGDGWFADDGAFRWTEPHATARLFRPEHADEFEVIFNVSALYITKLKHAHIEVSINGRRVGGADFDHSAIQPVRWKLEPAPAGTVEVTFETSPPYPDERPRGSAIFAFGFLPKPEPQR